MKHLIPKLFFIVILLLGISSFVFLQSNSEKPVKEDIGNTRFNTEMDNGFEEMESMF